MPTLILPTGAILRELAKIFVVFQDMTGVLFLRPGEVVTDVQGADYLFIETSDGRTDLTIAGSRVTLTNTLRTGKGYILTTTIAPNQLPVADAGQDQTVTTGATVQLDGTGSKDAYGNPLTYSWQMTAVPSGSNATLSAPKAVRPSFVADQGGQYIVSLQVNNGKATSDSRRHHHSPKPNSPPVAHPQALNTSAAKAVQTVLTGSDPDGDPLTFHVMTSPVKGTLSGLPPSVMYTPNAGFSGNERLLYHYEHQAKKFPPATVTSWTP